MEGGFGILVMATGNRRLVGIYAGVVREEGKDRIGGVQI